MSGSKIRVYLYKKATMAFGVGRGNSSTMKASLEQIARETINQTYYEDDPSVMDWLRCLVPSSAGVAEYVTGLFPSAQWVRRYNLHWLLGDVIAGVTVGLVVVPQAMAYALLARLSPAFGLYTTFTGACIYWIFGTSKDIVIGTTAVGSLLVGGVISKVEAEHPGIYKPEAIAHALSFLAGGILLIMGLLRLGWLIEFIPYVPISAFVTSASITIISTQLPTLLGITGINSREAPYTVYVNTLKGIPRLQLDAVIGVTCMLMLQGIKTAFARMEVRQPEKKRVWSLLSSLRLTFAILLYTFISWLVNRNLPGREKFRIVGHIEKGFSHAGVPEMNGELFGAIASELPAIVVILIVEHIAIAKSFGRIFGYTIQPSQEMIAQGASNILSPFVGGYVCTGSFGASAVLSKAAVRTPLAGLFSAMILVLALYALTPVFYYIPNAALAGLIIHCTFNLITPPRTLVKYWQYSPFELFIWVCGVVIAFFTNLETAIYVTVGLSFAMLLVRMARNSGQFRGTVRVTRAVRDTSCDSTQAPNSRSATMFRTHMEETRQVYLPYSAKDNHNRGIKVEPAYPGVFIYHFAENFNYINQASHIDHLTTYIKSHTRRTRIEDNLRPSDSLWCERPPSNELLREEADLPILKAVVLDFSTVNIIDITSLQGLIQLRSTLQCYAAPAPVAWHISGIHNSWSRRALAHAGFGFPTENGLDELGRWSPAYPVVTTFASTSEEQQPELEGSRRRVQNKDDEKKDQATETFVEHCEGVVTMTPLYGIDRPCFHVDLHDAVNAAVRGAKRQDELRQMDESAVSTRLQAGEHTVV